MGTDAADGVVGSAVASDTAVGLADEVARDVERSTRDVATLVPVEVVEGGSVAAALRSGAADAAAAVEVFARAEGRFELCPAAGPAALPAVEPVADGCDDFEEPSSAQAIPHVVKIAAPTPSATASPPTRPIHREALIVHGTGRRKVLQGRSCAEPPTHDLLVCPVTH